MPPSVTQGSGASGGGAEEAFYLPSSKFTTENSPVQVAYDCIGLVPSLTKMYFWTT